TFATLLKGSGEDVKTVQELMRHANSRLTLDVYAQALTQAMRAAHLKIVEMIQPAGTLVVPSCSHAEELSVCKCLILWSGLSESNRHLNLGKVIWQPDNPLD